MAGFYNLTSQYGRFDVRRRFDVERNGLDSSGVSLMETSQGGMGAPPWEDPQRYLRNSPLMRVAHVRTPIMLMSGDMDYVSTTQTEEFFTALARLDRECAHGPLLWRGPHLQFPGQHPRHVAAHLQLV